MWVWEIWYLRGDYGTLAPQKKSVAIVISSEYHLDDQTSALLLESTKSLPQHFRLSTISILLKIRNLHLHNYDDHMVPVQTRHLRPNLEISASPCDTNAGLRFCSQTKNQKFQKISFLRGLLPTVVTLALWPQSLLRELASSQHTTTKPKVKN